MSSGAGAFVDSSTLVGDPTVVSSEGLMNSSTCVASTYRGHFGMR
ncbi:hypothetical protein HanXRQr2_Chr16g0739801 [Helianthus annuus]|uniref:Uncharacterized protein n=1 Tax=Helianthus annuus TaxID=4232 RepID=A0A9K3DRB0_HELAN|nr:hypothetical protein HanXRQr2_Chr16g0739801 [Helianthus annuus]KAJ0820562.1 hypothetical protein HanPSC8_Chr16g0709421 [Helianthus annuus]